MAINSYSTLKDSILKWLIKDAGDSYYTSSMLDDIIYLAEAELSRRLRIREMLETDLLTMTSSLNAVTLPADFREAYSVYYTNVNSPQEIQYASPGFFSRTNLYQQAGLPSYFFVDDGAIVFGPTPDAAYQFNLKYYADIPNLSGSQTTNNVLTKFPDLYLTACLKQAYIASQDVEREGIYEGRLERLVKEVNTADTQKIAAKGTRGTARNII
jgi:hypothetical protein